MDREFLESIARESSWCEISRSAIASNINSLRTRIGNNVILGVVVKADGFGHGIVPCAKEFIAAGADWLIVNFAYEAKVLRQAKITAPIYICGNVSAAQSEIVAETQARIVVYDRDVILALAAAARKTGNSVPIHIKIETGTHRQGLPLNEAIALAKFAAQLDGIILEGITTHYADIEDTIEHDFANQQLNLLQNAKTAFQNAGLDLKMVHSANSAATILWPKTHGSMVRVGIAAYGLWPSRETYATVLQNYATSNNGFIPNLVPVLSWRARIVQVKEVPTGGYIGYGRTFRATHPMKIAILPLGYHEGYDRRLSNLAHVIIKGVRSPVRGRICMNMTMVDVTHIPGVKVGDIATLLGRDGEENVSAEQLANWMGTINYEVISRINSSQPRFVLADESDRPRTVLSEANQPLKLLSF